MNCLSYQPKMIVSWRETTDIRYPIHPGSKKPEAAALQCYSDMYFRSQAASASTDQLRQKSFAVVAFFGFTS